MRSAIFSGLSLLLASLSTPAAIYAQTNVLPEASGNSLKATGDPSESESVRVVPVETLLKQLPPDVRDKLSKLPAESRAYVVFDPQIAGESACGHILILKAAANVDPKIASKSPEGFASNMPVLRGLPPCSQDVRGELRAHLNLPALRSDGVFVPTPRAPHPLDAPSQPKP